MDGIELVAGVATGENADHRCVAENEGVGHDLGPGAARESNGQQLTVASQSRRRLLGHGTANRVVDDIHPAADRHMPQAVGQVAVSMVDGLSPPRFRQNSARALSLTTAITRAPSARPSCTAAIPLPPAAPSTASLARRASTVDQTHPCGEVGYPEARGLNVSQAGWNAEGRISREPGTPRRRNRCPHEAGDRHDRRPEDHVDIGTTALTTPVTSWPGVKAPDGVSG